MLTYHVALVTEESSISLQELTAVAAALQKQVERDFGPIWSLRAEVSAFASLEDVPLDYWPVIIKEDIGDPSALGYHEDDHGQPYSLVKYDQHWTLTASHEVLEMLGDPFGRRMIAGQSPMAKQGRVRFLVEVCDPCEASQFAYKVNGIVVSDFYTPHYFDPDPAQGGGGAVRYSYTGSLTKPRQVLKGGYLSWYDSATRSWWQRTWFGAKPSDKKLAMKAGTANPRAAIDRLTQAERAKAMKLSRQQMQPKNETAFANRALDLRACVAQASRG